MSVSLYRKYRPQNFASVVGQKSAVDVITNSITKSKTGHAYLFSGSRGCGKTSLARIFAKALNCLDPQGFEPCGKCKNCTAITAGESLDVIEIDGASNNGVDEVRELKANVTLSPFSSKYKIYIIDEVHMLSTAAFNALLKTLEEPPEYVVFILATTEPHKVPVTIRSRCQHIPFHSISTEDIYTRLNEVCSAENIAAQPEALWEISRQADGALRDALSLLEQVIASGAVSLENVEKVFGAGSRPAFERWIITLRTDLSKAYADLKAMFDSGASSVRVFEEIFSLVRNLWLVSRWNNIADNLGISEQEKKFLLDESKNWKTEKLHFLLNAVMKILTNARLNIKPDILLGMFMMYLSPLPEENTKPAVKREVLPPTSSPPAEPEKNTPVIASFSARVPEKIEYDANLKEKLLNIMHDKNFKLYCALFNSRPFDNNGSLILDIEHRYCYEVLRQERNASGLAFVFGNYKNVILRYGQSESICPNYIMTQTKPKTETSRKSNPALREIISGPENQEESEHTEQRPEQNVIDKFRADLAQLGAKPEILFIRHGDNNNENADNNNEDSSITETEGENE